MDGESFTIGRLTFDGDTDSTIDLPPLDLSRCQSIRGELVLTAAADDATDLLDVTVESRIQGTNVWNERMRFGQLNGGMTVSAAAPEVQVLNLQNRIPIEATEEGYEATGSAGASALPAGAVRNGPFPDKDRRNPEGLVTSWRVKWNITDTTTSGDFTATLTLIAAH